MTQFDWRGLLRASVAIGLKPGDFWRLTPAEFELFMGRDNIGAPLSRDRLNELAAAYPDAPGPDKTGKDGHVR